MGLSQDNNVVYTKVAKRINLFMTSPLSRPMGDPSLDHMRETGFEIIIRTKFDESFHQIPHLIKKLKRRSNTNSQTSKHVIYCVLSYGVLRKKDRIEFFDDCTITVNKKQYENDDELYRNVLTLLPLGLREHWLKYYTCFQSPR
jgi:hypothetical protein